MKLKIIFVLMVGCLLTGMLHAEEATDLGQDYGYHDLDYENIHDVLPAVWMQHARELYNMGKLDDAAGIFKKVLAVYPGQPEAQRYLNNIRAKKEGVVPAAWMPERKSEEKKEEDNLGYIQRQAVPAKESIAPSPSHIHIQQDLPPQLNEKEMKTIEKKTPQMDQGKKKLQRPY